jgi:hypothetical protein
VRIQSTSGLATPVTSGHMIANNLFRDMGTYQTVEGGWGGFGGGVLLQNSHYAMIRDNVMTNVRTGIQTGNFQRAYAGTEPYGIANNQITTRRNGIMYNLHNFSPWVIANNTITGMDSVDEQVAGGPWRGMRMLSLGNNMGTSTFTNNTVDGSAVTLIDSEGINIWNVNANAPVAISGGSIRGVGIGIHANNFEGYNTDTSVGAHATVSGMNITDTSMGIRVNDSTSSTLHGPVQVTVGDGMTLNGSSMHGVSVENAAASVPSIGNVAFVGQIGNYVQLVNNATTIDATTASFEGKTGAGASVAENLAIEDKLVHKQDNEAIGLIRVKNAELFVTANSGSIQRGVNNAVSGDTIHVQTGTFGESVTVNKQVRIIGAGTTATIIEPVSGASPAILVSGSGADATNRLVISDLSINTPSHRDGTDGISIQPTSGVAGFITIDNVNVARHGQAVHVRSGSLTDVVVRNADLSDNSTGVRVATAVSAFDGFVLENSVINNSRSGAYSVNPSGTGNAALTNFVIRNTTFANNSTVGVVNAHDISFFGYNGNATLENVTLSSGNGTTWNANSYAISFTNSSAGFAPAGNIVLNNVAVTGHVAKGALSFQYYNDVSNISLNNVNLQNVAAGWGDLIVHHAGSTAFNAGNTQLKTVAIWWTGAMNAENVVFANADGTVLDRNVMADGFAIADRVVDGLDAAGAGIVRYVSDKLYVTTNTFLAPSTLNGAFDRAVAAAREGETVVVQDGVPTVLTAAITKNITFDGFFTFRTANLPEDVTLGAAIIDSFLARKGNSVVNLPAINVTNAGSTIGYFDTIQSAINSSWIPNGAVVNVSAGTYAETVTVSKSLEIRGPNYGISPNTGTRVAEAIIVPATTNTDATSIGSNMVTIAASDVVIDGLTIDGDNPSLADSTVGFVGSTNMSMDAARGVYVASNGLNNIRVANNVVQNVSSSGIRFQQATNFFASTASSVFSSGNVIDGNRVENIGSLGIDVRNSMYTAITNNVVNNARYGVYVNSFRISNQAGSEYQEISGNTITARQMGIWMNLYAAEPFTIRDNSISAVNTGDFTKWYGVMLSTISTPQNMVNQVALPQVLTPERWTLSNNSISGSGAANSTVGYGYWLWSVDNNQTADGTANVGTISGGTVSNVDVGLFMHNVDTDAATNYGIARTGAHASIANVTMNVKTGGTGLQIKDGASWATANIAPLVAKRNVSLLVGSGVTVNGGAKGLVLEDSFASVDTVSGMAFSGQTASYIELVANTSNIDATGVSFEGKTGATASVAENLAIEDKLVHKQDNTAIGLIRVKNNELFVTANSGSIQRSIDLAAAGDVVTVGAGSYQTNLVIDKQIKLFGAGSSSAGTVITAASGSLPIISVTGSGVDAANPLSIDGFNLTGASFSGGSDGIAIQPTNPAAHIAIRNVAVTNQGQAIHYRSGTLTDMSVANVTLEGNSIGLRVATAVSALNGLTIDAATMNNNASSAIAINPSGPTNPNLTNFTITNSSFTNNSTAGVVNQHDLSFYAFRGNLTMRNVQVNSGNGTSANSNSYGILFTNAPSASAPAGTVLLEDVTVSGHVGKGALSFQTYNDVSGIQLQGVDLSTVVAPWGDLITYTTAGTTLALNDTKLKTVNVWGAGNIDATAAQFVTSAGAVLDRTVRADLFAMANQVGDAVDVTGLGLIRFMPDNIYVTMSSGSLQRGIDAATAGDTVNVAEGMYQGTVTVSKSVKIVGDGMAETIINGNGSNGFNITAGGISPTNRLSISNLQVTGSARGANIQNNADNVTFDQVAFVGNTSTGLSIDTANTSNDVQVIASTFTSNGVGLKVHSTGVVSNLVVEDSAFTDNVSGGIYSGDASASFAPVNLSDVTVRNNTFTSNGKANNQAGIYIERIENSAIEGNTFVDNGIATNPRAVVMNLKHKAFTGLTIEGNQISETRGADTATGFGMFIAARNDGSYASAPASLDGLSIIANEVTGMPNGVKIANNVDLDSVVMTNNSLTGGLVSVTVEGSAPGTMAMRNNSITEAGAYFILNESAGTIDARSNWFGTPFIELIESKFLGQVDYDPSLEDGTDVSTDVGFQN